MVDFTGYKEYKVNKGWYIHTLGLQVTGQDPVANTSRVRYTYTVHYDGDLSTGAFGTATYHVVLNGVDYSAPIVVDFSQNRDIVVMTDEITVTHTSTGTFSLTSSFSTSTISSYPSYQAMNTTNAAFALPAIPQASTATITPTTVHPADVVTFTLNRKSATYTHDITWAAANGQSGTVATGVGASTTWTPDVNTILAGQAEVFVTVSIQTKSGTGNVGAPYKRDLRFTPVPNYPVVGNGTPYDFRFRRVQIESGKIVAKETIPFIEASLTESLSASGTCSLTTSDLIYNTSLDNAVVMADVFDGSQWLTLNLTYVLSRVEEDDTDQSQTTKYSGTSYADFLLSKLIVWEDKEWKTTNPGNILQYYMSQGISRNWGYFINRSFDATNSSAGTGWQTSTSGSISKTTPVSQLLEGWVGDGLIEYNSRLDGSQGKVVISAFNPGTGKDWASPQAKPVINMGSVAMGKAVDTAPVRKDYSTLLTRVNVYGDDSGVTRENVAAINPIFGHLEGSVQASGVKGADPLKALGDATLDANKTGTIERTYNYNLSSPDVSDTLYPWRTFRPGDFVLVPGPDANRTPLRVRVSQVSISRGSDNDMTATVTIGDIIPSGVAATAKKQAQTGGNAIAGGDLKAPVPSPTVNAPAFPDNVTAVVDGYWDPTGAPKGSVVLSWNPVTTSVSGSNLKVDLYEIWGRQDIANPWVLQGISTSTTATFAPLEINSTWIYHIRARSTDGNYGDYSNPVTVTLPLPDELLAAPSDPIVSSDALGTVSVKWNGQLGGTTPPLWFNYLVAEISTSQNGAYTRAGTQLTAAGTIVVPNVGSGTFWFRLVAYDTLNQRGTVSNPISVAVTQVVGDNRVPKAPTNVTASSAGYWNGSQAESKITVNWTAVTQATDDSNIGITLYDVWGKLSGDTTYQSLGTTNSTSIVVQPIAPVGSVINIQVRAMAENDNLGAFSSPPVNVTMIGPVASLLAPSAPDLNSNSGVVIVKWDGQMAVPGAGEDDDDEIDAPPYLASVDIQVSVDGTSNWQTVGFLGKGDRSQSVGGLNVDNMVYFRFVAYDAIGQASPPSEVSSIVVSGYDGGDIVAGTITGNQIQAGSITVNQISPTFGSDLDITANGTVSILTGQATAAQATADQNTTNLNALRTRYDFTPTEAVISQPGSTYSVAISNTQMEFREGGVARAFLNAGVFNAPRMATSQVVWKYHVMEDDATNGTVVRRLQ